MAITFTTQPSLVAHGLAFTVAGTGATPNETVTITLATSPSGSSILKSGGGAATVVADGAGAWSIACVVSLAGTSSATSTLKAQGSVSGAGAAGTSAVFWPSQRGGAHVTNPATSGTGAWAQGSIYDVTNSLTIPLQVFVPNRTLTGAASRAWRLILTGSGTNTSWNGTGNNLNTTGVLGTDITAVATTFDTFAVMPQWTSTSEVFREAAPALLVQIRDFLIAIGHNIDTTRGEIESYSAGATAAQRWLTKGTPGVFARAHLVDGPRHLNTAIDATSGEFRANTAVNNKIEAELEWARSIIANGTEVFISHGGASDQDIPGTTWAVGSTLDGTSDGGTSDWLSNTNVNLATRLPNRYVIGGTTYSTTNPQVCTLTNPGGVDVAAGKWGAVLVTGDAAGALTATYVFGAGSPHGAGFTTKSAALAAAMAATLPAGGELLDVSLVKAGASAWIPGTSAWVNLTGGTPAVDEENYILSAPWNNTGLQTTGWQAYSLAGTRYLLPAKTQLTLPAKTVKAGTYGAMVVCANAAGVLSGVWDDGNAGAGYATEQAAIRSAAMQPWPANTAPITVLTEKAAGVDWVAGTDAHEGCTGGTPASATRFRRSIGLVNAFAARGKPFAITAAAASAGTSVGNSTDPYVHCVFGSIAAGHSHHVDMIPPTSVTNSVTEAWLAAGQVAVSSVAVSPATPSVAAAATVQLTPTVTVVGGATTGVTWSSSDAAVATVDGNGLVTGVGAGSATITARSTFDTSKSGTATVTVSASGVTTIDPRTRRRRRFAASA